MQSPEKYQRIRSQTEDNFSHDDSDLPEKIGVEMHEEDDDSGEGDLVIVDHTNNDSNASNDGTIHDDLEQQHRKSTEGISPSPSHHVMLHRGNSLGDQIGLAVATAANAATGKTSKDGYQKVQQQNQQPSTTMSKQHLHKRTNSWDLHNDEDDDDDDDDDLLFEDELEEEDAQVVRRYVRNRIPIVPAEFSHRPIHQRVWQSFVELRTAARQRRAARLLNDSQYTPTTHCVLTWCCDATDRGIALVAICVLLWLVIGWTQKMFRGYWLLGMILFAVRVSARRTYENFVTRKRRGGGGMNNHGLGLGSLSPSASGSSPTSHSLEMTSKDYRDHA